MVRLANDIQDRHLPAKQKDIWCELPLLLLHTTSSKYLSLSRERWKPFVTIVISSRKKRRVVELVMVSATRATLQIGNFKWQQIPVAIKWPWNCPLSGLWQYIEWSGNSDRWSQQLSILLRRSYVAFSVSRAARYCRFDGGVRWPPADQRLIQQSFPFSCEENTSSESSSRRSWLPLSFVWEETKKKPHFLNVLFVREGTAFGERLVCRRHLPRCFALASQKGLCSVMHWKVHFFINWLWKKRLIKSVFDVSFYQYRWRKLFV